jgi:hypothetical protein
VKGEKEKKKKRNKAKKWKEERTKAKRKELIQCVLNDFPKDSLSLKQRPPQMEL